MKGYLLNFYKFSPSYNEQMSAITTEGFNRSIVWSVFDRLEIKKVVNFAEYRKSDAGEKNWLGERQFAMLYELKEEGYKLQFRNTVDECKFVLDLENDGDNKKVRFFGISFIDFTQNFHAFFYGQSENDIGPYMHRTITEAINSIVAKSAIPPDEIAFDVYGILGGQDLAIIWLTNQFEYIAQILETLRNSSSLNGIRAVANVSSIIGINDINDEEVCFDDVKGKLLVKLTKRETYDDKMFKEAIKGIMPFAFKDREPELCTLFGEHDLLFEIPANKFIPQLYKRDGLFNTKSPKFSQHFIQSKTEIIISGNYNDEIEYKFPFKIAQSQTEKCLALETESKKLFGKIEEIVSSECFERANYLQETLWLLYEDFLKNITSSFSYPWSCDLYYQFEESMNYLAELVKSDLSRSEMYDNIHGIISGMRQMMLHVAQANKLFFEVPNTHLRHTGSYSKILHMYYGVVKKYLELSYYISKYDHQSNIIPFISFDVTPIAKSEYCDFVNTYQNNIVRIELPYDALVNIPKYIKLLAHEIYHYISPRNRQERNLLVASISFSLMMGQIAGQYLNGEIENGWEKEQKSIWIVDFQNIVRIQALNHFVDGLDCMDNYIHDKESVWEKYFKQFDCFFENSIWENDQFIGLLYNWVRFAVDELNNNGVYEKVVIDKEKEFRKKIIAEKDKLIRFPLDRDVRYALREARADYFMVQVTGMSFGEYVNYLSEYQELMESDDDDIAQRMRCALGIDLFLRQEIDQETKEIEDEEERNNKIYTILKKHTDFSVDKVQKLANDYIEIRTAFQLYDKAFELYFKEMDFNEILAECPKFKKTLENIKQLLAGVSEDAFLNNIKYVEKFQKQETLRALESEKDEHGIITAKRPDTNLSSIKNNIEKINLDRKAEFLTKVSDLSELLESIGKEIQSISENGETQIWFRGHESIDYLLIPSLYRMKDKKKYFYAEAESRREILESLLDLFKVKAYNAPELIDKMLNDDVRVMAAMQHYTVPTNLLDWTTSVFTAIYFALMVEINEQKSKNEEDAVIYLLNPIRMNVVRNRIYKSTVLNARNFKQIQYPIPAIASEKSLFAGYLPNSERNEDDFLFPIAGYVPFDNSRIKAQLGTFTIFGLDNQKDCYGEDIQEDKTKKQVDFSKCSLWDMQEKYREICQSNTGWIFEKFLARVVIDGKSKLKIANLLRVLGMTKSGYFPELENLSQDLTSQVSQYLSIVNK